MIVEKWVCLICGEISNGIPNHKHDDLISIENFQYLVRRIRDIDKFQKTLEKKSKEMDKLSNDLTKIIRRYTWQLTSFVKP